MNGVQHETLKDFSPIHPINICRICLAPEKYAKLHDIHSLPLARILEEITGCTVGRTDGLPPFVCSFCSRLLQRFNGFRQLCLSSSDLLHDAGERNLIYLNLSNKEEIKYYKPLLTKTPLQIILTNETDHEITTNYNSSIPQPLLLIEPIPSLLDDDLKKKENKINEVNINNDVDDENDVKKEYEAVDIQIDDDFDVNNDSHDVLASTNDFCVKNEDGNKNDNTEYLKNEMLPLDEGITDNDCDNYDNETPVKKKNKSKKASSTKKELDEDLTKKTALKPGSKEWAADFCKKYNFKLTVLSKEDQIKEVLERKESSNYKESPYKCDVCYKGFMIPTTYENHLNVYHSPNDPYACEICGFRFKKKYKLNIHVRGRHLNNFKCKQCDAIFKLPHTARYHYDWHNGNKCNCEKCGKEFRTKSAKRNHVRRDHSSVQCSICNERLVSDLGLQWHFRLAHNEALCATCNVHFYSAAALKIHAPKAGHCDPTLRPCLKCGEGFASEDSLKEHITMVHEHIRHACEFCKKTFTSGAKLSQHIRWTHSNKMKRSKEQAKKNSKKFMCEICGKDNFVSRALLAYHQRSHTGERPHKCTVCEKSFTILNTLKIHMTVHTDERKFKCSLCPKAFRQQHHVQSHMLTHTKERPYACKLCPKTYTGNTSLKEHIDVAHRGLPARKWKKRTDKYTEE